MFFTKFEETTDDANIDCTVFEEKTFELVLFFNINNNVIFLINFFKFNNTNNAVNKPNGLDCSILQNNNMTNGPKDKKNISIVDLTKEPEDNIPTIDVLDFIKLSKNAK